VKSLNRGPHQVERQQTVIMDTGATFRQHAGSVQQLMSPPTSVAVLPALLGAAAPPTFLA
jgi:hypothetical protein